MSTATVSRVINKRGYRVASPIARAWCSRAVERAPLLPQRARPQPRPWAAAASIGLIVSDIANPFFPDLVKEMESAAFEHGFDLILANTNYDAGADDELRPAVHRARRARRRDHDLGVRSRPGSRSSPSATSRSCFSIAGRPSPHISHLVVDYQSGIDEAVMHLAALGHRRIAFVGGPHAHAIGRSSACAAFAQQHRSGASGRARRDGSSRATIRFEGGRCAARELLQRSDAPHRGDRRPTT